jgi:hypothetical protein
MRMCHCIIKSVSDVLVVFWYQNLCCVAVCSLFESCNKSLYWTLQYFVCATLVDMLFVILTLLTICQRLTYYYFGNMSGLYTRDV